MIYVEKLENLSDMNDKSVNIVYEKHMLKIIQHTRQIIIIQVYVKNLQISHSLSSTDWVVLSSPLLATVQPASTIAMQRMIMPYPLWE